MSSSRPSADTVPTPTITKETRVAVLERVRELGPPSALHTTALLATAFGGWAASIAMTSAGGAWLVPAVAGFAVATTMLSVVVHECAHHSLFDRRAIDDVIGYVAGLCALTPFFSYRRGHLAHHRWVGSRLGKDPTGRQVDGPEPRWKPNRLLDAVVKARVLPILFWVGIFLPYFLYDLFPTAGRRRRTHLAQYALNLVAMSVLLAAVGGYLGTPRALALMLPGYLVWGVLNEHLFTVTQHFGLRPVPEGRTRYDLDDQVNFSRSIAFPLSWLFFHHTLHKEHHLFPGLSFQRLPLVRAELRARSPAVYAFTRGDWGAFIDRRRRFHEMLTLHAGDGPCVDRNTLVRAFVAGLRARRTRKLRAADHRFDRQGFHARVATSDAERRSAFRLRHHIYVDLMGVFRPDDPLVADGMFRDGFDDYSTLIVLYYGDLLVGTMRVTLTSHGPLELERYRDLAPHRRRGQIACELQRLMILPEYRSIAATRELLVAAVRLAMREGATQLFGAARLGNLGKLFQNVGARVVDPAPFRFAFVAGAEYQLICADLGEAHSLRRGTILAIVHAWGALARRSPGLAMRMTRRGFIGAR